MSISAKEYNSLKKTITSKIAKNIPAPTKISPEDRDEIFEAMQKFKANPKRATDSSSVLAVNLSASISEAKAAGESVGGLVSFYLIAVKSSPDAQKEIADMIKDEEADIKYREQLLVDLAKGDAEQEALAHVEAEERRRALYEMGKKALEDADERESFYAENAARNERRTRSYDKYYTKKGTRRKRPKPNKRKKR